MKKIVKLIVMFSLLSTFLQSTALSENPLDSNWRDYVFDKEAWLLGPATKIIADNQSFYISCTKAMKYYDSTTFTIFNLLAELKDTIWYPLGIGDSVGIYGRLINDTLRNISLINNMIKIDSLLYIGGVFDLAGNIESKNIAIWNNSSSTWSSVGDGVNGIVTSFANYEQTLFVAGYFDTAGTVGVNNLASWDGTFWSDVGGGTDGVINSIILKDDKLILGGEFDNIFTSSSTFTVNNLAVLDITSSTWSTLGDGVNGIVNKICVIDSNIYIAGFFDEAYTSSSTISVNNIAVWNGSSWDSLQCGIDGMIDDMINFHNQLIVVGDFINIGNDTVNNIAKWDGNSWSGFGSGTDGRILCIASKGDSILIGGEFLFTGDIVFAENIGLWYEPPPPLQPFGQKDNPNSTNSSILLNIYPNPSKDNLTIEYNLAFDDNVSIKGFDLQGNEVFNYENIDSEKGWNKKVINTNKFTSGSYIIKLTTSSESISKNFIIMR